MNEMFDSSYVSTSETTKSVDSKSETKKFLKEPIKSEDIKMYGSSKPQRLLIRAQISNG